MGKVNGWFVLFCVVTDCLLNAFKTSQVYNDSRINDFKMTLITMCILAWWNVCGNFDKKKKEKGDC